MTLRITPAGAVTAATGHTVDDATLAGVVQSLGAYAEAGYAGFAFALSYKQPNGTITSVDLTMTLTVEMPVWTKRDKAKAAEQREWDRFHRALRVHEDGHIAIFRREAATTYAKLLKATPGTINDILAAEQARIQDLSDKYDTKTQNGITQPGAQGTTVITVPASAPATP